MDKSRKKFLKKKRRMLKKEYNYYFKELQDGCGWGFRKEIAMLEHMVVTKREEILKIEKELCGG
jgi:hypothetical protein